jgi:hypothetical protein
MKSTMRLVAVFYCGLFLSLVKTQTSAAEPAPITPQLAPDAAVMKIIDGLGEGCSAVLPKLKTTGDINDVARRYNMHVRGPGARDYCIKMVWMPDRKRAVFYGANHGSPHRCNDVWEYDLPSNTWVCLYGPDLLRGEENWEKYLDRESLKTGIPRTKRGGPAVVPHSWWQMAYDPGMKAMLTFCSWSMVPKDVWESLRNGDHKPPLWAFYPEKKKWEPITGGTFVGRRPRYHNSSALDYVPSLGKAVWCSNTWANAGMWTYDSKTNTWTDLKPHGGDDKAFRGNAPGGEQVIVVVPDRNLLVGHRVGRDKETGEPRGGTYEYSFEKNEWRMTVPAAAAGDDFPAGHDSGTNFAYDHVGKVCLLWDTALTKALWAYDPGTERWTKLSPKGPPPPFEGRDAMLAYYDAERNVFVIPGRWVYRHK